MRPVHDHDDGMMMMMLLLSMMMMIRCCACMQWLDVQELVAVMEWLQGRLLAISDGGINGEGADPLTDDDIERIKVIDPYWCVDVIIMMIIIIILFTP
jgi:hypothetical protein